MPRRSGPSTSARPVKPVARRAASAPSRTDAAAPVRDAAEAALAATGLPGRAMVLRPDRRGIVYGDEAEVRL